MRKNSAILFACLGFLIFNSTVAWAQPCYSGYMYDFASCPFQVNTVTAFGNTPPATNSYVWPSSVQGATLVSGQGQPVANYYISQIGHVTIPCTITSSQYGCTYVVNLHYYGVQYSTPNIQGAAIPTTCTGSQTFTYYATHWTDSPSNFGQHRETHMWTVQGGTTISQSSSPVTFTMSNPYLYQATDTIKIAWNGLGPRRLILERYGTDQNINTPIISSCSAYDTLDPVSGSAVITGPAAVCLPAVATYTVNPDTGYAYTWSVTGNGSIASGQGTPSVQVNWTGSGSVSVTKSFLWCPMSYSATKAVAAGGPPTPNLGPNTTFCSNSGFALNAGSGTAWAWSTGATTQTIQPTASGTYSVTVSNGFGCTASSSVTLTMLPSPTPTITGPTAFCVYGMTTLDAGPGYSAYHWSTGVNTQTANFSSTGTYGLTVTDANGCTGTSSATLTYLPMPTPNLGPDQVVCAGALPTLNPGSFSSYLWSTGATSPTIVTTAAGSYEVTVTAANGCTASDTMQLTVNALPTFSLGADTIICADTTIVLTGPVGMSSYAWSTSATSSNTTINAGGTYSLTVTDANGCSASDAILIQGLTDCVFPGDANYDGVADNQDILSIGAYYGRSNGPRANATTQWYGQNTPDWGSPLPGQADPKHSDCDGDGLVAAVDTNSVTLNYGQTHSKAAGITTGGVPLRVVALQDSVMPGDLALFEIRLGDAGNQADSAYGLAFTVNYTHGVTAAPGIVYVDYSNCWFAPVGLQLPFSRMAPSNALGELAIVRIDQQQQLGFGEVCHLAIATDPNLVAQNAPLQVWLSNIQAVDAQLGPQAVEAFADSAIVSHTMTGVAATMHVMPPRIFPNPAQDQVQVVQENALIRSVQVLDATGSVLHQVDGVDANSLHLRTVDLAQGIYFLHIRSDAGTYMKRLAINR